MKSKCLNLLITNSISKFGCFMILYILIWNRLPAQITATIDAGCSPLDVTFSPPSGMTTYYWDFDDGSSSVDPNPTNKFINPKNPYSVTLRASKNGPILYTKNIQVFPKPTITTSPVSGCEPLAATLNPIYSLPPGVSTTSMRYIYGDGNSEIKSAPTTSPGQNTYSSGTYSVTYELTTSPTIAGCDHSVTIPNLVSASKLLLGIGANPTSGCNVPFYTDFTANVIADRPIISYEWDFGDGNTSTLMNPSHIYNSVGSYSVTLKVKDDNNCEKTVSYTMVIKPNDMTKILCRDTVCINTPFNVSYNGNSGLVTNSWNFYSAYLIPPNTVLDRNCSIMYGSTGVYTIDVTSLMGSVCPKTISKTIVVVDPQFQKSISPLPLCNRINTLTLTCLNPSAFDSIYWYLGGSLVSKNMTATVTDTVKGLDSISWTYGDKRLYVSGYTRYGCVLTFDTPVISPIIAHIAPCTPTYGCAPLRVGFQDKTTRYRKDTMVQWKIDFGDGVIQTFSSFDTIFHTYTNRGSYDVRMIAYNKYGCFDTTYTTKIYVGTQHIADFTITPNGGLCASDPNASITLQSLVSSDSVQSTKFWADGFQCHTQNSLTYKPSKTASTIPITMEVGDHGCFSSVTKTITNSGPIAKFQDSQNCNAIKDIYLLNTSLDATHYEWDFGDGGTSTSSSPSHTYANDGNYTVKLIAYNSLNTCPADTYTIPVKIQTPLAKLSADSFVFCNYNGIKLIDAPASSGYINDGVNTGLIWEFSKTPPFRSSTTSFNYESKQPTSSNTIPFIDTVYLTARNFMNCLSRDTAPIKIDAIFASILSPSPNLLICNNDVVNFDGSYSALYPAASFYWNFGDLGTSNLQTTIHQYTNFNKNSPPFSIMYTVTNSIGCQHTESGTVNIKNLGLYLEPTSNNLCFVSSTTPIQLKANAAVACNYTWKLPNGSFLTGNQIAYQFPSVGSYSFEIYVQYPTNTNCVDTMPVTIMTWDKPNLGILTDKDNLTVLCDPISVDVSYIDSNSTAIVPSTIKWNVQNLAGSSNYATSAFTTALVKGSNQITLIASNTYCSDTTIRNLLVKAPTGQIELDRNNICKGDVIQFTVKNMVDVSDYAIDFGDGFSSTNISPVSHQYNYVPIGGKTKAKVVFSTNNNACIGKPLDTTIFIYEVFAKFGIDMNANPDTPICFRPVHIKDSSLGANSYRWRFSDGTTWNQKEPGYRSFPSAGTYYIELAISNTLYGCKDTFRDSLVLLPKPKSSPTNDTVCLGQKAKVYQLNGDTILNNYTWNPSSAFLRSKGDTNYVTLNNNLTYTLIAINKANGCSDSAKGYITVLSRSPRVVFDTIIAPGQDITLPHTMTPHYKYQWIPDSFLSCTNCNNPTAQYLLQEMKYRVTFTDSFKNCFPDTSYFTIRLYPDILVNAPTAFTPNGDGNNDVFYARGFGIKRLKSFKVFNRWGQLLFFSTSEYDGWDGNYKGTPQNSDTYFYTIEGESYIKGKTVTKDGNILLLR